MASAPDNVINKLIVDIQDCVQELKKEFKATGVPIDDDNTTLHNICDKLEYLLQDQLKEKYSLLGNRKNYWDYFCKCLASKRGIHDGLKFVKSVSEFKTSVGRGRAFIRYCLVHQCLADTLQQCFQNGRVTSDFYNKDSLLLQFEQSSSLITALYDLNELQFDLASHGHDLDVSWPTFARKVFGAPSLWRAPSRAVSLTSLSSTVSQSELVNTSLNDNGDNENRTWSQLSNVETSVVDILAKVDELKMEQSEIKEIAQKAQENVEKVQGDYQECSKALTEQASKSESWWQSQEEELRKKLIEMEQMAGDYARKLEAVAVQQEGRESSFQKKESELEEKVKHLESVKCDLTSQIDSLKEQLSAKQKLEQQLSDTERGITTSHNECTSKEVQTAAGEVDTVAGRDDQKGPKTDLLADKELLEVEVKSLREENLHLNQQTDKWRKCIAIFSEKLAIKERVNEHLEKQVAALKEAVTAMKEVVLIKGLETTSLRNLVQELKSQREAESGGGAPAEKIGALELENVDLKETVSNLNINIENLKRDLEANSRLLQERETALACVEAKVSALHSTSSETDDRVTQLTKQLDDTLLENQNLNRRLDMMRAMLKRVEKAEEELEKLEAAEGSSTSPNQQNDFKEKDDSDPAEDGGGGGPTFGCTTTTINFVLCDEASLLPEDFPVFTVVKRTVGRLHTLISEKQELLTQLKSSNEINSNLISKVQEQEQKLSTVTFELSQTKALVEQLKNAHSKLQTSEAILRYELKEKRGTVERMKQMLEASRAQWMRIRQKHTESELEWQSLRADFASRVKQESVESGFIEDSNTEKSDERESSVTDDAEKHPQSPSGFSSDIPPFPSADGLDLDGSVSSPPVTSELEDLPESQGDDDEDSTSLDAGQSRTRLRMHVMEEQCRLLYSRLVASIKKSEFLEWKLSQLHGQHGTPDEDDSNPKVDSEKGLKDVNANFDIVFVPFPGKAKSHSLIPADDLSEYQESITDCDQQQDVLNTEGEISESLSCDTENSAVDDVPTDQLALNEEETTADDSAAVADDDNEEEGLCASCEGDSKPQPLAMAQALPKRIELLRRKKEDLEESMKKLTEEKSISDAREADMLSQLEALKSIIEKRDTRIYNLEVEKADLVQREIEFKKRADFIMRKEREEKDARYQTVMKAKQEISIKFEMLQNQLEERQEQILNLEMALLKSTEELELCKTTLEQEVASLRFQLSSEALKHEKAVKNYAELEAHIANMQDRISEQEQLISCLEEQLEEIKLNRDEEKEQRRIELEELKMCLATREEECTALNEDLKITTRLFDNEKNKNQQLKSASDEMKTENAKYKVELGELNGDVLELKKKLIKLIREKDLLWKRSERLSFIQKIQATDRWLKDEEVTHCLGCKAEFTMLLRKHHCRLCGRIFCSSCCNHWAMTTSSSRQVRVCNECILSHSQIEANSVSFDSDDESLSNAASDLLLASPSPQEDDKQSATPSLDIPDCDAASSLPVNIPTPGTEDRLAENSSRQQSQSPCSSVPTDEKFNRDGNSLLGRFFASWSLSPKFRVVPDDDDDEEFYVISDEEIMRSLSQSSPYAPLGAESGDPSFHVCQTRTTDEILVEFANNIPREVWVNAGKGYAVPVSINKKTIIMWEFTTEPKSIAFSLLFHAATSDGNSAVEVNNFIPPTQILIPITQCDSHLRAIHGKLVAKKPGIYTFYFDNGFSKFMAKKVKFILHVLGGELHKVEAIEQTHHPVATEPDKQSEEVNESEQTTNVSSDGLAEQDP